ncbi:TonB-dependent receptor [Mucilaginibacter hurinus]|uniref:TonB-dependent receptor n=1 Tax=Mucilaginibacter hurinus TaxID=2201324 RepID=A0A367GRN0_9SPHI|nr:TonB-dependent receptor [Mucilaginibacter hurinus]RCH55748.1 TonB-dependent receptor [Mucilaginibacter hurinus]
MKHSIFLCLLLLLVQGRLSAHHTTLKGRVVDNEGNPLPGATLTIPDLKIATNTGINGEFAFPAMPARGKFIIQVQFMGYATLTRLIDLAESTAITFVLQPTVIETREVVITGTPISGNNKQNSTSATTVNRDELLRPAGNIIDALAKLVPGVSQITTGPSISKPVIRGLGYNRVVTLNNGIKQQGQQWGDEHGIEIDQYGADRVEVLRGAASLLYGSDALGGVINLLEPLTPPNGEVRGELLTNYATNNGLTGISVMLTGNHSGFVWRGRGSYKNAHAFKTPAGYFPNSGFNESNISGMLGVNKRWGYSHINFSYFKNNIGLFEAEPQMGYNFVKDDGEPFTDEDFKSRKLVFPRQDIRHYKLNWDNNLIIGSGYLKVNLGYQKNQRRELEESIVSSLFFDLNTYSGDAKYYLPERDGWQPVIGASTEITRSINKGEEYLVPDYNTYNIGTFAFIKKTWNKNTFNAGVRYDYRKNTGKGLMEDELIRFTAFTNQFSNISGALGFTHQFNSHVNFKANAGSAFRAPNPAELASNGVHEGTFRYEIGNPNLAPERSYQADATLEFENKVISASIGIYENYIHNFIYATNTPGDVRSDLDEEGNTTTYDVYRYSQVNANLWGFEGSVTLHPVSFLHFENTFGYTHAQNRTLNRPLAFIPAGTLKNTLRFEPDVKGLKQSYIFIGIENFFKQSRFDKTFETGTEGYTLLSAGIGTTLTFGKQPVKLYVAGSNLLNKKYYDALSRYKPGRLSTANPDFGIYNPGRNIMMGIYLPF